MPEDEGKIIEIPLVPMDDEPKSIEEPSAEAPEMKIERDYEARKKAIVEKVAVTRAEIIADQEAVNRWSALLPKERDSKENIDDLGDEVYQALMKEWENSDEMPIEDYLVLSQRVLDGLQWRRNFLHDELQRLTRAKRDLSYRDQKDQDQIARLLKPTVWQKIGFKRNQKREEALVGAIQRQGENMQKQTEYDKTMQDLEEEGLSLLNNGSVAVNNAIVARVTRAFCASLKKWYDQYGAVAESAGDMLYDDAVITRLSDDILPALKKNDSIRDTAFRQLLKQYRTALMDKANPTKRDQLWSDIHRDFRDELDKLPQPLFGGSDRSVVQLSQKMFADDAVGVIDDKVNDFIEEVFPQWSRRLNASQYVQTSLIDQLSYYKREVRLYDQISHGSFSGKKQLLPLKLFRDGRLTREIFADKMDIIDEKIYQKISTDSLGDSADISTLSLYPRPESIRNLVLVAASGSDESMIGTANQVLSDFARRPDWGALLDQTIAMYPELGSAHLLLEQWSRRSDQKHPLLPIKIQPFADAINSGDYEKDPRLIYRGFLGASMESMLARMMNNKKIDDECAQEILNADQTVRMISRKTRDKKEKNPRLSLPSIDADYFTRKIRESLSDYMYENRSDLARKKGSDNYLKILNLARAVNQHKNNSRVLNFLTNDFTVSGLLVSPVSGGGSGAFFEGYQDCPYLLSSKDGEERDRRTYIDIYCKIFKNSGDAIKINQFIDATKEFLSDDDHRRALFELVNIINNNTLTIDEALDLVQNDLDFVGSGDIHIASQFSDFFVKTSEDRIFFRQIKDRFHPSEQKYIIPIGNWLKSGTIEKSRCFWVADHLTNLSADVVHELASCESSLSKLILNNDDIFNFVASGVREDSDGVMGRDVRQFISTQNNNKNRHSLAEQYATFMSKLQSKTQYNNREISYPRPPYDLDADWEIMLKSYVSLDVGGVKPLCTPNDIDFIKNVFASSEAKNFCWEKMQDKWWSYLAEADVDRIPDSLLQIGLYVDYCGGAGPLSQIEGMGRFVVAYNAATLKNEQADNESSRQDVFAQTKAQEEKMSKCRWGNDDRAFWYNISADVLQASPDLYVAFGRLFEKLKPVDAKRFTEDVYPLYRAQLALAESKDSSGQITHDPVIIARIKQGVVDFSETLDQSERGFARAKKEVLDEISQLFKQKFGIAKVPENFGNEEMRSLSNFAMYLANMNGRDIDKEAKLGFYLALKLNKKWDDFRSGKDVLAQELITPEAYRRIAEFLKERKELNPLSTENCGVAPEDIPEMMKMLQVDGHFTALGEIDTIDVKLNNITTNLRGLLDPDLYPDVVDKERLAVLSECGNKLVGAVAAKWFGELSGKSIEWSEEEQFVKDKMIAIMTRFELEITIANLKEHWQTKLRPLGAVVNLTDYLGETRAEYEIENLQALIKPGSEVVAVFQKLGESFKVDSGAFAISQDLNHLENLIVKREDEISAEEKIVAADYLQKVRDQLEVLQSIYDKIQEKFAGFQKSNVLAKTNPLLAAKAQELERIISNKDHLAVVSSTMTGDMNLIIENMRECLACVRQGCNNDTDLSFGDSNKFYLFSRAGEQNKRSIADEILFLEPITRADGTREMSFVFDKIYEQKTLAVLLGHIQTVLGKYMQIKDRFPEAKLSLCVTKSASSGILAQDSLAQRLVGLLGDKYEIKEETISVNVVKSAASDHYIEFGGRARSDGKRDVEGIVIALKSNS